MGIFFAPEPISPTSLQTGFSNYLEYYIAIVLGYQLSFAGSKHDDIISVTSGFYENHRLVWPHILFTTAITCIFLVLTRDISISRLFLFTYLPILYFLLVIFGSRFHIGFPKSFLWNGNQKLLLIGEPEQLIQTLSLLKKSNVLGFKVAGILTDASDEEILPGFEKLGGTSDLEQVLENGDIGNVLILGSPRERRVLRGWMIIAEKHGCRLSMVNDLNIFLQRRLSYFRFDELDMIELREEPLQNVINRLKKRTLDIVISLPVVCLTLPILIPIVWLFQRKEAPGPLFFRQERSFDYRHRFTILKFRTMYVGNSNSSEQAKVDDDRIFPAGRWMRRFSIDEFPQFVNVLLGQMSLVGPRPHMPQHDKLFAEMMSNYHIRSFIKPGITGLAQIRGFRGQVIRSDDIVHRVESDIEYIETWSFSLDIRILWRTLVQCIRPPKSAYDVRIVFTFFESATFRK